GINDGGQLRLMPLPKEAQFSAVRSSLCRDIDGDGTTDIILGGNLYQSEVETPRADAGLGLVLRGLGQGKFQAMSSSTSGLTQRSDLREIRTIRTVAGLWVLMVANDDEVGVYRVR
ncbi:MAG: hypothetical protein AB8H12_24805, partial [Lewinella sp.]